MFKKLVRSFWVLQPRFIRRLELALLERLLARPLPAGRRTERGDVVVCGLLGTASGLGLGARQMLRLFKEKGLPVHGANASRFAVLEDFDAGSFWPDEASEGGFIVFHINPDILALVFGALGRNRLKSRRVAGLWAWELETPPPRWARGAKLVDEIWAPSRFVAEAMKKIAGGKPVHAVTYPLDVSAYRSTPKEDPLPELKGKTVVFFSYDVRSLHARKNPEAVVEAFRRAAGDDPDVALVIKINNNATWPESKARIERAARGLSNVMLLEKKLSDEGMKDLMARADVVMSLHRSEGFGLLMAEGMASSKPVIATGWSANLDFMTPDCSVLVGCKLIPIEDPQHIYDKYGGRWADPNVEEAAAALKRLLSDPAERKRLGEAARAHIEGFFSREKWFASLPQSFWDAQENPPLL